MSELIKYVNELKDFETIKKAMRASGISVKDHKNMYMLSFLDDADFSNTIVRQANGVIFEKESNKLLHYSFEKCYENFQEPSKDPFNVNDLGDHTIELYFEGSLIKVFYYENEWKISTSRHICAENNFWSSKRSFTELFKEAIELTYNTDYKTFLESLNTEHCYTYLMQHPDNKMVMNVGVPVVFVINQVNLNTLEENRLDKDNLQINKTLEDIKNDEQNYMVFNKNPDGSVTRIKILKDTFVGVKNLRGNYPDIGLTYLENIKNEELKQEMIETFPVHNDKFVHIDNLFSKVSKNIHSLYIHVYAEKQSNLHVPESYKKTLHQLHGQYRKTKKSIKLDDVVNKLLSLNAKTLAFVLEYKY